MFFFSRRCKHRVRHVLTHSFPSLRSAERRTEAGRADFRRQVEGLSLNAVEDPDPIRVLPALATLRALPGGYAEQGADVPLGDTFGLYQGEKLGGQAIRAYRHAINTLLLPRLLIRDRKSTRLNSSH